VLVALRLFALAALGAMVVSSPALALPSLQLGPGAGSWTYDAGTGTWVTPDNPLQLLAFANATAADGGNGDYPWSTTGTSQIAYLVISAVPKTTDTEPPSLFDVTVDNDAGTLSLYTSGNGAPPLSDPNDLAPHGIFDTYYEIYEFNFDGPIVGIYNTQTGLDPAQGYEELFDITINSLDGSVEFLHFDLFTIVGSGSLGPTDQVLDNAPFTHDAQTVPEPGTALLLSLGLLGLAATRRSR
jgi:hypothetical protein